LGHLGSVTVSESNETSPTEKLILRALIFSVLLHLLLFSVWRVGKTQGWWRDLALPRWLQSVSKAMLPVLPKKPALDIPSQTQLTFVDVDPALATPEPPKNAAFFGAKNTVAANHEIKQPSPMPNIDGTQENFLKTTENVRPTPQPAAPAPPPAPTPVAAPTPPAAPALPQNTALQNAPKKSFAPGDLTMSPPSEKPQEGKPDAETGAQAQPPPKPQPQPPAAPARPRTLAEAAARNGSYGAKSRSVGGVNNISPNEAENVRGTPLGDYIAHLVEAVRSHWYDLLNGQPSDVSGKVQVQFRLLPDGTVTNVKLLRNEVTDLLGATCEEAIKEPAPYEKWPREVRLALPNDFYDITFTFYYEP
jgi:hypothetical protein